MARKSAGGGRSRKGGAGSAPRDPIDAALELAAQQGWRHTSLADVAAAAHVRIVDLYAQYPSRAALLAGFVRRIDIAMLERASGERGEESERDRLFEVIMRRFDLLQPHRDALHSILRDPQAVACGLCVPGRRALRWILVAAGIDSDGLAGRLRLAGLGAIYLGALRVFLRDDNEDLSKTMAALDRHLRQAENLLRLLPGRRRKAKADAE